MSFPDDPWAGFRKPGFPVPPGTPQVGPRVVSTTTPTQPGMPGMTLDALMQRQKELAGQRNPIGDMTSPMQGIAYALKEGLQGFQQGSVAREERQGRDLLAQTMAQVDPVKGPTPEQAQVIWQLDPDLGTAIYGKQATPVEHWTQIPTPKGESGQWFQNSVTGEQKKVGGGEGAAGPKETEINALADDFNNVPDVKNFQNAQSMWRSMQDAAATDTAQADLNLIIATAKLFDPTSVVRTEEGEMVRDTGGLPSGLYGQFLKLTGKQGARLDRETRKGLMHEGFSRMNSYYKGVQEASDYFTKKAARRGYNPLDIVRPFEAPVAFDPEKVVGSPAVADDSSDTAPDEAGSGPAHVPTRPDGRPDFNQMSAAQIKAWLQAHPGG